MKRGRWERGHFSSSLGRTTNRSRADLALRFDIIPLVLVIIIIRPLTILSCASFAKSVQLHLDLLPSNRIFNRDGMSNQLQQHSRRHQRCLYSQCRHYKVAHRRGDHNAPPKYSKNDEIECGPSLHVPSQIAPPSKPPTSGTVLLYNRFAVRNYKKDGHDWIRKRSNPAKIREDHVKLRYNGAYRVGGNYVHSDEIETLHRRVYRLIKTDEEKAMSDTKEEYVLVHYLDTEEAAKISMKKTIAPQPSSSSTTAGTKRMWSTCSEDTTSPYMCSNHEQYQAAPRHKKFRTDTGSYKHGSKDVDRGSTTSAYTQQQDPHSHMYRAPHANQYSSSTPGYLPTMVQTSFPSVITPPIPIKEVAALDSVSFDVLCKAIDDNNSGLFDAANFYCQV